MRWRWAAGFVGHHAICHHAGVTNREVIKLARRSGPGVGGAGDYILWEAVTYGGWTTDERFTDAPPGVQTLDEVKASGRYRFLASDQLIAEVRDAKQYGPIVLHPLVGGMPVDEAWKSVQLLTDAVLPAFS